LTEGDVQDEIKMDYPLMEEMKRTFQSGREQLQDTMKELKSVSDKMEQGALLGQAGSAFTDAIKGALMGAVTKLSDKFEELEGDLQNAVNEMHQAEEKAKTSFS
jgi:WXG100 family type VII secretion target